MSNEQPEVNRDPEKTARNGAGADAATHTGSSQRATEGGASEDKEAGDRMFIKK